MQKHAHARVHVRAQLRHWSTVTLIYKDLRFLVRSLSLSDNSDSTDTGDPARPLLTGDATPGPGACDEESTS